MSKLGDRLVRVGADALSDAFDSVIPSDEQATTVMLRGVLPLLADQIEAEQLPAIPGSDDEYADGYDEALRNVAAVIREVTP